jgi:D-alanine-D-alanine ligase
MNRTSNISKKSKLRIGIIFGGRSPEHEVSLVSAASVIRALDKKKYEVIQIGILPDGRWISAPNALELLKSKKKIERQLQNIIVPDPNCGSLLNLFTKKFQEEPIDVIFPVLHGAFGEDGTIQGLLEMANIPYVGAGVLGSSVAMDKVIARQLFRQAGIPLINDFWFLWKDYKISKIRIISKIEKDLGYPCFVKPANSGSSVGISKVHNRKELSDAIHLASQYDRKILVEKSVAGAREIEVSVLGNDEPATSILGEIIPSNEFYDYDAKYVNGKSKSEIPARLPKQTVKKIQEYAILGYKAIDCSGMARADFLIERKSNKIYLNELNTIPGFTSISMYPKLWEASGLTYTKLLDTLIGLAIERHTAKSNYQTFYKPKEDWYKS